MSEQPDQNPPQGRSKTTVIGVSVAVALVLGSMGVRATMEQSKAYAEGVSQQKAGDLERAIVSYRRAVRWYTPWGPAHGDAVAALREIAEAQRKVHPEVAIRAFDGLRSGLLASRSIYQPRADDLAYANDQLPGLLARVADRLGDKREGLLKRFQADYQRPVGVSLWVTLGVVLGFLLWIGGLVRAWYVGVNEQGRLTGLGWRWVGGSVSGFAVWALTLWLAP